MLSKNVKILPPTVGFFVFGSLSFASPSLGLLAAGFALFSCASPAGGLVPAAPGFGLFAGASVGLLGFGFGLFPASLGGFPPANEINDEISERRNC